MAAGRLGSPDLAEQAGPLKFLFDQAADFRLIPFLTAQHHDVTAVSRDYPAGIGDEQILELARREGRICVTADLDFGELLVVTERSVRPR
jgi:predicted nuclease of predicted toxin-antitoxin system